MQEGLVLCARDCWVLWVVSAAAAAADSAGGGTRVLLGNFTPPTCGMNPLTRSHSTAHLAAYFLASLFFANVCWLASP